MKLVCYRAPQKPATEPLNDRYGWRAHDKGAPKHAGSHGHYCHEWDGLWICADCPEFEACVCFSPEEKSKVASGKR